MEMCVLLEVTEFEPRLPDLQPGSMTIGHFTNHYWRLWLVVRTLFVKLKKFILQEESLKDGQKWGSNSGAILNYYWIKYEKFIFLLNFWMALKFNGFFKYRDGYG